MSEELKSEFIVGAILTEIVRQKPDREIHSGVVDKVVEAAKQICDVAVAGDGKSET